MGCLAFLMCLHQLTGSRTVRVGCSRLQLLVPCACRLVVHNAWHAAARGGWPATATFSWLHVCVRMALVCCAVALSPFCTRTKYQHSSASARHARASCGVSVAKWLQAVELGVSGARQLHECAACSHNGSHRFAPGQPRQDLGAGWGPPSCTAACDEQQPSGLLKLQQALP